MSLRILPLIVTGCGNSVILASWSDSRCSSLVVDLLHTKCLFLVGHLLVKLEQELIELSLLFHCLALSFCNLGLGVDADGNAEEDLEAENNNDTNCVAIELYSVDGVIIA